MTSFRIHLYKTKIMIMSDGKNNEIDVQKQGKKEIKAALEMYQQWRNQEKTSSSTFYDDSVTSNSRMNQCALLLKANLELLKSNPTKAMKLCTEAHAVADRMREKDKSDDTSLNNNSSIDITRQKMVDEVQYLNNMACLHFNAGKFTSALFYFQNALKCLDTDKSNKYSEALSHMENHFARDGRSCPIPISEASILML